MCGMNPNSLSAADEYVGPRAQRPASGQGHRINLRTSEIVRLRGAVADTDR